jgi:hypothetical protein
MSTERATGSEPRRRFILWVHRQSGVVLHDPDAWGLEQIEKVEVEEVGSGHDEQTERRDEQWRVERLRHLANAETELRWKAERERDEAEARTVAAVVEDIRAVANDAPAQGETTELIGRLADAIERKFGSSVSGGE